MEKEFNALKVIIDNKINTFLIYQHPKLGWMTHFLLLIFWSKVSVLLPDFTKILGVVDFFYTTVKKVAESCGQKQTCFFTAKLMKEVLPIYVLLREPFFFSGIYWNVLITMVHREAILKGLNKHDLIKPVLQLESEMNSDIKELTSDIWQMKKVKTDVAIVKNVNEKLVNQLIVTEWQCSSNLQYSRCECLEVVGIPTSIPDDSLFLMNLEFMLREKTFRHVIV